MLIIRLTIKKPLTGICFSVSSVLLNTVICELIIFIHVQGCTASPVLYMYPCVHSNSTPLAKRLQPKSDTLKLRRTLLVSHVYWTEKYGTLDPPPCGEDASFSVSLWAAQPTSGKHKILELLFVILPLLCSWHIWTHWMFNSYLKTCFCWIFAFSPWGGLASDILGQRGSLYNSYGLLHLYLT